MAETSYSGTLLHCTLIVVSGDARNSDLTERDDVRRLRALNDVLRVASRCPDLFGDRAFEELIAALAEHVEFGRAAVVVREHGKLRVYIAPRAEDGDVSELLPSEVAELSEFADQPHVVEDMLPRQGLARLPFAEGFRSGAVLPMKGSDRSGALTVGHFVVLFREAGQLSAAPLDFWQEVADLLGAKAEQSFALARQRRLANILDAAGDAMLAWSAAGVVVECNEAASALTGIPKQELTAGIPVDALFEPAPLSRQGWPSIGRSRSELVARAGSAVGSSLRIPVSVTITPFHDDPSIVAHALIRDESETVAAEREAAAHLARIHLLENELRTLLDNAPLIIFRLDPATGQLLYLNRHAERLLRVPIDEALRTPGFLRATHSGPEGAKAFDEAVRMARRGRRSAPYEARLCWGTEAEITVRGDIYPLVSEQGVVIAIEGILADVSAEHEARARLVQADRLSTLGMLAAGVAHEINNPATFLMLGLSQLDRMIATGIESGTASKKSSARNLVAELRECLDRIVSIARDLRLFANSARTDVTRASLIDVNRTVHSALTLTRTQIMSRARIDVSTLPVARVVIEDGRLCQVLVNLLVNAAQAIAQRPGAEHVVSVSTRTNQGFVEIEVRDTGVGVAPENLDRIWLPFFTTKDARHGTGLGLSISRQIVEHAGGTIDVHSPTVQSADPPFGSSFTVRLPAADAVAVRTLTEIPVTRRPTRRLRVLVVDDEVILARALAQEIGEAHDVSIANSGPEALALMAETRFDAVLCDISMPGMSGETLYELVRERDASQAGAFIFMTGLGFGAGVETFLAKAGRPWLEKPFKVDQLLEIIDKIA